MFGVVAFVQVPVVHLSVVWWRTLHQPATVLRPGDPSIDHMMLAALLVNVLAFTLLYLLLLRAGVRLAVAEEERDARQLADGTELAGTAIVAPRLERTATDV